MDTEVIDWSVATRPLAGETESGDDAVVALLADGALVAAVDGLGHGSAAAEATAKATELIEQHADEPLVSLVERCHQALRTTRGVAMSLARFSAGDDTMTWVGVGNVEGRLVRQHNGHETLIARVGAAGYELQPLHARTVGVQTGDTLVFATDGIDSSFADSLGAIDTAEQTAREILRRHAKPSDDALVVVARYLGAT
jgi:negative regulator of sigma-B (phosphoserine phosphatase)